MTVTKLTPVHCRSGRYHDSTHTRELRKGTGTIIYTHPSVQELTSRVVAFDFGGQIVEGAHILSQHPDSRGRIPCFGELAQKLAQGI